jgi:hypothetical protein
MVRPSRASPLDRDLQDILEGKKAVTLDELIRLIHRVNPSGKDLPAQEAATRYRLKAQLQSLLIRRFADALTIECPDPKNPELIGLRRTGFFDDDACHALVGELDHEAQDWVNRQLAARGQSPRRGRTDGGMGRSSRDAAAPLAAQTGEPSLAQGSSASLRRSEDAGAGSLAEILARGRQALAEYDYAACEECARAALARAGNDPAPALLLLELFVDHLADDEQALALAASLPAAVASEARVVSYLVADETRLGRAIEALARARRAGVAVPAETLLAAGRAFLAQGELERAKGCLHDLEELPALEHREEVAALRQAIRAAEADRLAPLERPVRQALADGRLAEAQALAESLLAAHPGNPTALHALQEIKARQRQERIQTWLASADEAAASDDPGREAECLRKAIAAGAAPEPLRARLEAAQARDRDRRAAAAVRQVIVGLDQRPTTAALRAYLELPAEGRRQVREAVPDRRCVWLETLAFPRPAARPENLIAAVEALAAVEQARAAGEPADRWLALLEPHYDLLRALPAACDAWQTATAQRQEQRKQEAIALLDEAGRHLDHGRLDEARAALDRLSADHEAALAEPDRQRLRALKSRQAQTQELARLEQRHATACHGSDWLAARQAADELAAACQQAGDEAGAATWRARAAEHQRAVNRAWGLLECSVDGLPPYLVRADLGVTLEDNLCCLPEERTVVLASSYDEWVFLRFFDMDAGNFRRVVVLRVPEPFSFMQVTAGENSLWVVGDNGGLFELALAPLAIRTWIRRSDWLPPSHTLEDLLVFPQERIFWGHHQIRGSGEWILEVYDIDRHKPPRRLSGARDCSIVIRTGREPLIAFRREGKRDELTLYTPTGRSVASCSIPEESVFEVAIHPNGRDFLLLGHSIEGDLDDFETSELTLYVSGKPASELPGYTLHDSDAEAPHEVATALSTGMIYVVYWSLAEDPPHFELVALRQEGEGWQEVFRSRVAERWHLLTDQATQRVWLVECSSTAFQVTLLGDKPPVECPRSWVDDRLAMPGFNEHFNFGCGSFASGITVDPELVRTIKSSHHAQLRDLIQAGKRAAEQDPDRILPLCGALYRTFLFDQLKEVADWFGQRFPDHPWARLQVASKAAEKGEWEMVRHLLHEMVAERPAALPQHAYHLLGMAQFRLGQIEAAIETWKAGQHLVSADACPLAKYVKFAEEVLELRDHGRAGPWPELALQARLDEAYRAGRWSEVVELAWEMLPSDLANQQLLARVVAAWLQMSVPPGSVHDVGKVMAIGHYLESFREEFVWREIPLLPWIESWPRARLDDLAAQAREWLTSRVNLPVEPSPAGDSVGGPSV